MKFKEVAENKVLPEAALFLFLGKGVLNICSKFTREHPCKATLLKSHVSMGVLQ